MKKYYIGSPSRKDDFGKDIKDEFVDGKTLMGPWAIMAPYSFRRYGLGLGLGRGQRYQRQTDNKWLKIEG